MTENHPPLSEDAARFYTRAAFALLFVLLVLRLITATRFGLAWDEAYYWQWSRALDLGYYDAGPGIALVIRAGTALWGNTPLGVRFVPILMGVAANALMFAVARRWFDARVGFWTTVIAAVSPLLAIGSVFATYDLPQIFWWAAGLYAVTRAVTPPIPPAPFPPADGEKGGVLATGSVGLPSEPMGSSTPPFSPSAGGKGAGGIGGNVLWWYITGLCVGLGTITKPTMLLFAPGVLILLAVVPAYRKHLTTPHPYLAFALTLLCLAPLFVWNAGHDNVNWVHTLNRGNRSTNAAPGRWLGEFWGGQALVLGPVLLVLELIALVRAARTATTDPRSAFVAAFTVPILALCTLVSLRSKVEINWCVAAHLTGILGLAAFLFAPSPPAPLPPLPQTTVVLRSGGGGLGGWGAFGLALSAALSAALFFPNALVIRPFGPLVASGTWEKVNEQYGWETIASAVEREHATLVAQSGTTAVFYAGTGYRVCSILAFYLPGQPRVEKIQIPHTRRDQYEIWTDEAALSGQNAVVAIDMNRPEEEAYLRTRFRSVSAPIVVDVPRPGFTGAIKSWRVYRCVGLRSENP